MFGNGEIGHSALGQVDDNVAPSPVFAADAEFTWAVSAEAKFEWNDDDSNFKWE